MCIFTQYTTDGDVLMNFFNPESKVMIFLGRITDYLILTLLWVICSIPIFTIGASTTAMFYTSFKILDDEDSYVTRCFFKSFKENFKQSTLLWLVAVAAFLFFVVDFHFYSQLDQGTMRFIGLVVFGFLFVLFTITMLYLFPYVSRFHCTFKQSIKVSLLLGIRHLFTTILIAVVDAAIVFVCLYYLILFIFMPGFLCLANSFLIRRVFKKYMPEKEELPDDDSFMTIEEIEARDAELAEAEAAAAETDATDVDAENSDDPDSSETE